MENKTCCHPVLKVLLNGMYSRWLICQIRSPQITTLWSFRARVLLSLQWMRKLLKWSRLLFNTPDTRAWRGRSPCSSLERSCTAWTSEQTHTCIHTINIYVTPVVKKRVHPSPSSLEIHNLSIGQSAFELHPGDGIAMEISNVSAVFKGTIQYGYGSWLWVCVTDIRHFLQCGSHRCTDTHTPPYNLIYRFLETTAFLETLPRWIMLLFVCHNRLGRSDEKCGYWTQWCQVAVVFGCSLATSCRIVTFKTRSEKRHC